ncbi:MAG: DUF2203 domain-containing protein [Deinococcota bacterium]
MFKLFSINDANTLISTVDATLQEMQAAARDLAKLQATLADTAASTVQARNIATEMSFLASELQEQHQSLARMGVFISDLERGLVLFPSQLGAEVIHLSWQQGEAAITHYHGLLQRPGVVNERLPLPDEFLRRHAGAAQDGHLPQLDGSTAEKRLTTLVTEVTEVTEQAPSIGASA